MHGFTDLSAARRTGHRAVVLLAAGSLLTLAACSEDAEDYPTGSLEMMIPWTAGGGSDLSSRLFASHLEDHLGVSITPANEPGANGSLGWGSLAQDSNDGYNIGLLTYDVLSNEVLDPQAPAIEDFDILGQYEEQALFFYVRSDSEYESAEDLEGSSLMIGTSGMGGIDHQAPAELEGELGVEWQYTPFDGHADGLTNLLGGNIDAFVFTPNIAAEYVESGDLRILGTFAEERVEEYPDVPTFAELGYEVAPIASFRGIAAPAGLDEDVRATLVEAIAATAEDEEYLEAAEQAGNTPFYRSGEDFEAYMNDLRPVIEGLLTDMGLAEN
ncbi:Bug family tripartite tricarboxylate transporter substrate binding protein [Bogoriella caseilytica]|uniref:Tripartite-type tricarboxylate transporter receptor subunit TctC n=1 Tax=Bogoriella caseilytica TaxID=56055 RepID=A0A3N2BCX1_9MICO|nr:tripartite tricarboxylate transporter substrate binding protein [Bogoriella caseilytica]ROR73097.1 tripartite-type tricarboxylate transporter receptor subunit TctC [Bogoriella caseilytica]